MLYYYVHRILQEYFMTQSAVYSHVNNPTDRFSKCYIILQFTICVIYNNKHEWKYLKNALVEL